MIADLDGPLAGRTAERPSARAVDRPGEPGRAARAVQGLSVTLEVEDEEVAGVRDVLDDEGGDAGHLAEGSGHGDRHLEVTMQEGTRGASSLDEGLRRLVGKSARAGDERAGELGDESSRACSWGVGDVGNVRRCRRSHGSASESRATDETGPARRVGAVGKSRVSSRSIARSSASRAAFFGSDIHRRMTPSRYAQGRTRTPTAVFRSSMLRRCRTSASRYWRTISL